MEIGEDVPVQEAGSPDRVAASLRPEEKATLEPLPSVIQEKLLRAVCFSEVVTRFGHHFSSNAATAHDYTLSERVDHIDAFISHEWRASRFLKSIALCFFYNVKAASFCSAFVAVGTVIFYSPVMKAQFVCPFIWLFCFLFWHRFRSILKLRPAMMFLDKLCIDQTDEEKKKEGISGLAGFLRKSRVMLILWTPRYFSRLWCAYELVSWFHLHENASKTVTFLPISYAFAVVMTVCYLSVYFALRVANIGYWNDYFTIIWLIPGLVLFLGSVIETRKVFAQLSAFSIRSSECFCCKHGHTDPQTGLPMVCDRKVVYKTLDRWFRPIRASRLAASEECPDFLDAFDDHVRCGLRSVLKSSGVDMNSLMTYNDALTAASPVLWNASEYFAYMMRHVDEIGHLHILYQVEEYSSIFFFIVPCTLRSMLLAIVFAQRLRPRLDRYVSERVGDLLTWLCSALLGLAICASMYATGPLLVWNQAPYVAAFLRGLRFFLFACCTLLVFGDARRFSFELHCRTLDKE